MNYAGLVSVSFRQHTPEEIIRAAAEVGLTAIEWGSDVHAPKDDAEKLAQITALQKQYGVRCCSYGTYFKLGITPRSELPGYFRAAEMLGTNILRVWAGDRPSWEYGPADRRRFLSECSEAAALALQHGMVLCTECHNNSYTQTLDGALELMREVNLPSFRMYWQPNQYSSAEENRAYARLLSPYIVQIHVFQWKKDQRFSLTEGVEEWQEYLSLIPGEHGLLLEFMPGNSIRELPGQAEALRKIMEAGR